MKKLALAWEWGRTSWSLPVNVNRNIHMLVGHVLKVKKIKYIK